MRQLDTDVYQALRDANLFIERVTCVQERKSSFTLDGLYELMYHILDEHPNSVKSLENRIKNILDNSEKIEE